MSVIPQNTNSPMSRATQPYAKRYKAKVRAGPYRKKGSAKPKGPVRRRYNVKRADAGLQIQVPECSQHYIKSLFDPWEAMSGVCIPSDLFLLPSQKTKCLVRGTFNIGTGGYGYIGISPTPTNDALSIRVTSSASVGGAATALSAFTLTGTGIFSKLPYSVADIVTNKQISSRIVACGIRVRYAGKETDRSGLYTALEEQDHSDLFAFTPNQLQQDFNNSYTVRPSGDGDWDQAVTYSGPTAPHMLDFVNITAWPIQPTDAVTQSTPLVILCQGTPSDLIEFEAVVHVEYIGKKVTAKTVSHADVTSYGKVLETTKEVAAERSLSPSIFQSGFATFVNKMIESAPKLINLGVGLASSLATRNPMPLLMAGSQSMLAPPQPGRFPLLLKG